jgi:hypothetical protein
LIGENWVSIPPGRGSWKRSDAFSEFAGVGGKEDLLKCFPGPVFTRTYPKFYFFKKVYFRPKN